MKILLASSSSGSRGGGELYLLYLGRALADRGHRVALWASQHPRMDELVASFGAIGEVHRSPYSNTYDRAARSLASWLDAASARRVAAEWTRIAPDVVHLNKQNLEDGLDLVHATALTGLPGIATIHLTQSARYLRAHFAGARDFVARRALQAFPGIFVTVLEDRRRDLEKFLARAERLRTVVNGVPLFDLGRKEEARRQTRAELALPEPAFLVIAVGRMVPQKRPLLFLDLAARLSAERRNARFVWIGDGPLASEWDRSVAERGLGSVVQRLPWQTDVARFLFAADLFLHVAEFEGLPLAVLEALSAGVACAITENLRGEMPFLTDTNSIAVREDPRWIRATCDPEALAALGAAGRQLAEQRFSYGTMGAAYESLYEEAVRSTG